MYLLVHRGGPEASTGSRGHAKASGGRACLADVSAPG